MTEDLPSRDGRDLPDRAQPPSLPTEEQDIQAVNSREEFLLRARGITRRVQERFCHAMGGHEMQPPRHQRTRPAAGSESTSESTGDGL
jgi:hypothetical protein